MHLWYSGAIKAFSDSDKVDIFNKYFSSASDVDDTSQKLSQLNNKHYFSFSNIIIDEQKIKDILSLLPVYNAIDPDADQKHIRPFQNNFNTVH